MPDFNLTNTAADINQALQDSVDLVTPLSTNTNSTTAYGDNGNGVSAADAALAIKGAKDGNIGASITRSNLDLNLLGTGFEFSLATGTNLPVASNCAVITVEDSVGTRSGQLSITESQQIFFRENFGNWQEIYHTGNTTVDGSGFIKQASPIVKLFANSIEKNDLVDEIVSMTKNSTGNYTISGSLGFAQTGWYIEQPKDANGQTKHFIEYQQDQDGTIHIQVYQPLFTSSGLTKGEPCDVVEGRWIDIRLQKETEQFGE